MRETLFMTETNIYKLAREKALEHSKKFSRGFEHEVRENGSYTMNCFYFGCIHQIDGDSPVLNGGKI